MCAPREVRSAAGAPVAVVAGGQALPIVTDDMPENRWAALFLARTIEEMSGCRPPVFVERGGQDCGKRAGLFLGRIVANRDWTCALTNESVEAFRVVAGDGCVRFLGRADFAVFDWCERELGLRYFCGWGKSVARRPAITASARDYSDCPAFDYRELGNRHPEPWVRVAKAGVAHRGGVAVHQPSRWYRDAALKAAHPDIFESGETPMLCYGNPKTLAYYKCRIDRHIAGLEDSGGIVDTNRHVVTVCQWDAPIKCRCAFCRDLYDPQLGEGGDASPIIWGRFLVRLSRWLRTAHPDYEISFLPYLNTCEVPEEMLRGLRGLSCWSGKRDRGARGRCERAGRSRGLLDNAEAELCTMPGLALLKNRLCRAGEERIVRDWRRVTGRKVLNWHYSCWPQERTAAPYVFGKTVQAHYADLRDILCGSYVCGDSTDPRLSVSMYVWMRCLWNPDVDVDAVYDVFAERLFGPSARPMRELIALQEECWNRQWADEVCSFRNVFEISFPREDVLKMKSLLSEARSRAVAEDDLAALGRVNWYASGFSEFLAESDALAARKGRRTIMPGETNEMVCARSAWYPETWAKTEVTTAAGAGELRLRVRCADPAAPHMDFTKAEDNFVWGNDRVMFSFSADGGVSSAVVDLTGQVDGGWDGFSAQVSHDEAGWTVEARVRLTAAMSASGKVSGNVSRWRVGDRRRPEAERVPGSRYEHSRLNTCFTQPDADPAAFVDFALVNATSFLL